MSAAEILGEHKLDRVILIGSPDVTAAVTDQISTRLDGARIERIDPAAAFLSGSLPEGVSSADVVTLAGAMVGDDRTAVESVDLIHPRKAPEKKDLRRIRILLATLAGLVIFAGGYFWRQGRITELTREKSTIDSDNAEIRQFLQLGEQDLAQAEKVGVWVDRDIEWLDELVRLRELLPTTDRMFIDNFQLLTIQQNGIGLIKLEGYAKSDSDISLLARKLRDAGYGVKPYEPEYRASAVSQDYGVKIVLEVSLPELSGESEQPS
jgi:hypothetical protein